MFISHILSRYHRFTNNKTFSRARMKFTIQQAGFHFSRVGSLTDIAGKFPEEQILTTPLCLLYTQGGNVPHVTHEVLQLLTEKRLPVMLPLPSILPFRDSVIAYPHGIGKFVGLDDYPLYCSAQDPAIETRPGCNDKTTISFWNYAGRFQMNVETFMALQEHYKPCLFQALCDSDTTNGSSRKRIGHAVSRSLEMLDGCLLKKSQSEALKTKGILGSIQGGFDINARRESAQQTALRPVSGFVFEGFHINGPQCELLDFSDIREIVEEVVSILPTEKPRIIHGPFRPDFIIEAVECGIDIFDSSFPFLVTERGCALCFDYKLEAVAKDCSIGSELEINLKDSQYTTDFNPILIGCTCYTCQNFTRAYVNHLLLTSELLSSVLLMLHNLHHFLAFFSTIRTAISSNQLHVLKEKILKLGVH